MVFQAKHRRGVFELHVLRHQIEALALALRRWQQGENLPAVVVDHNQHKRGRRLTQQRQRVEIVERGEIAHDRQRRFRAGALHARRRRDQPVDAAGTAVAVHRVARGQLRESVNQPHDEAVADKQLPLFRQVLANAVRQPGFAKRFAVRFGQFPRLARKVRYSHRPGLAFLSRMKRQPGVDTADQTTAAVVRRVKPPFQRIHQPVLFRRAGGLPLQ